MILTCPSCATSYFAPEGAIGPEGRTVRCKGCRHTWKAVLEEPLELDLAEAVETSESTHSSIADVPETVSPTATFGKRSESADSLADTPAPELPQAYRAKEEQKRRLRRAATQGAIWAGIAAGFAVLIGSALLFRVEVVDLAPRTAAAYAMVGLDVNPTGLDFEAVGARPMPHDPGKVLISGAMRNIRDDERVAPPVRVALLDADGAEIGHAVVRIDAAPVLPGKTEGFAAVIADPGRKGQGVAVDFASPSQIAAARRDAAPAAPAHRPLPRANAPSLRPALAPDPAPAPDMELLTAAPVDAVPIHDPGLDSTGVEALTAEHG